MREEIILPIVEGRRVLDCGGVDHWAFAEKQANNTWLHALMAERAAEVLGIDILDENIRKINEGGRYKFMQCNVEAMPFHEEFDVVVGGEIIEHLYNPGNFLMSARKALRPGGKLILTTPNALRLSGVLTAWLRGRELTHPEHTCEYTPSTLTYLVSHHGFRKIQVHKLNRPANSALLEKSRAWLIKLNPLFCETLLVIAEKDAQVNPYGDKW